MKKNLTTESHFKAYSETGLHYFTDTFIAEQSTNWSQHQGMQHLISRKKCLRCGKAHNHNNNECTKVQNPRRGYSWPLITKICMRVFRRKMADHTYGRSTEQHWIFATEPFQRKPHKFFDLCCPLST